MPVPDPATTVVDGAFLLDDLDLVRCGVPLLDDVDAPVMVGDPGHSGRVRVLEPEGVSLALLECTHDPTSTSQRVTRVIDWLGARPERPFEQWHRTVESVPKPDLTIMLDADVSPEDLRGQLATSTRTLLLVAAAIERDGQTDKRTVDRTRQVQRAIHALPTPLQARVALTIVPVSDEHPHRAARLRACAAAYSRGSEVLDLTSPLSPPPPTSPRGAVVFFTGLSGSGKSTLARALRNRLVERTDREVTLLDGDVVRTHLSTGLGFGAADRDTNVRRIGWVAARIAEHGGLALCSPIAPFARTRDAVGAMTRRTGGQFVVIHVATPLAECERRDRKGLYARARNGQIPDFTGISSPYEEPVDPDLRVDTTGRKVDELSRYILDFGVERGLWPARANVDVF